MVKERCIESKKQMLTANKTFVEKIWTDPTFNHMIGGGRIDFCELSNNRVMSDLDKKAGIDAIQLITKRFYNKRLNIIQTFEQINTMAIRVRYKNWRSFTVRCESSNKVNMVELDKKIAAINNNSTFPNITVQAHIVSDKLVSAAVIDTRTFYNFIISNYNKLQQKWNHDEDDTKLLIVDWSQLITNNINFLYFDHSTQKNNLPKMPSYDWD